MQWNDPSTQDTEQECPVPPFTRVTALKDFRAQHPHDLPFSQGDQLTVLEPCNVIFWYLAEDSQGKRGVIPINFVQINRPDDNAGTNVYVRQLPPKPAPSSPSLPPPHSSPSLACKTTPPEQPLQRPFPKTLPRSSASALHAQLKRTSSDEHPNPDSSPSLPPPPPPKSRRPPQSHKPPLTTPPLPHKPPLATPALTTPPLPHKPPLTTPPLPHKPPLATPALTSPPLPYKPSLTTPPLTTPPLTTPPLPHKPPLATPALTSPPLPRKPSLTTPPPSYKPPLATPPLTTPPLPHKPSLSMPPQSPKPPLATPPQSRMSPLATPPPSHKLPPVTSPLVTTPINQETAVANGQRSAIDIDNRPPAPLPVEAFVPSGTLSSQAFVPSAMKKKPPLLALPPLGKYRSGRDFIEKSGWFQPSVESVLCRKAMLQMPTFQAIVCGVFIFQHKFVNKKKYVGKSRTLYRDLIQLFHKLFERTEDQLSPLEVELKYNAPEADEWYVRINPVLNTENLDLEEAKMMVKCRTLQPEGLNLRLAFRSQEEWYQFAGWYRELRAKQARMNATA